MDIFEKLDIKPGINACGTVTRLGGSRLPDEVTLAMAGVAKSFVPMHEFHQKAGEYIAGLLEADACCITCGAAAGLAVSSAAAMTRGDSQKALQLPDTTGMPNEILMLKAHRILYDQALLLSGAKIREIDIETENSIETEIVTKTDTAVTLLEKEINDRTAMFVYVAEREKVQGTIPLPDLVPLLKKKKIPLLVDAAAELPPKENIKNYLKAGADLVLFSGGKEIRGPQASGLILGSKEFIAACHANCCPNYSIGRAMKISKEAIAGLAAAVELFVSKDYKQQMSTWEDMTKQICSSLEDRNDVHIRSGYPETPGVQPTIILRAYIKPKKMTAAKLQEKLLAASTPVYVDIKDDEIFLNPQCLEPEELEPLIKTLHQCLDDA